MIISLLYFEGNHFTSFGSFSYFMVGCKVTIIQQTPPWEKQTEQNNPKDKVQRTLLTGRHKYTDTQQQGDEWWSQLIHSLDCQSWITVQYYIVLFIGSPYTLYNTLPKKGFWPVKYSINRIMHCNTKLNNEFWFILHWNTSE